MKRLMTIAASLLWGAALFAQQALGPGTGIVSPEINADNTVTFRYYNPKAVTVQVSGDFLPTQQIKYQRDGREMIYDAPGRADLVEHNGMWTFTSAPLEGELYSYTLYPSAPGTSFHFKAILVIALVAVMSVGAAGLILKYKVLVPL